MTAAGRAAVRLHLGGRARTKETPPRHVRQTIPELAGSFALYFVLYEFIYYWWHRAMHEVRTPLRMIPRAARATLSPCAATQVPALYIWVHKHHHQQSYPDRAAIDTFNTGSVESQVARPTDIY